MKINPKKFAEALYASVRDKQRDEIKKIIANFANLLNESGNLKLIDKIIEHFSNIWDLSEGEAEAKIISARNLENEVMGNLEKYIAKRTKVKKIIIRREVDPNLIAGVVIKYRDKVLDSSLKAKIKELKETMIK